MKKTKKTGTPLTEDQVAAEFSKIVTSILENPNADGWIRLCEILDEAMQDKRIISSAGAHAFARLIKEIAADSLTAATEREALSPLVKVLRSEAQSDIAKNPRGKLPETTDTLGDIINKLAKSEEETAPELWPQLYSELDKLGLQPMEYEDRKDQRKSEYRYATGRHITFGQFANRVSEFRKKSG